MKTNRCIAHILFATLLICIVSIPSHASIFDVTVFGGIQDPGKITFETAPGTAGNLITTFNPHTFGVMGARFGHGGLIGGEHTLSYAPNFLEGNTHAVIYHSNLRIMPSIAFVKPYATAGIGAIFTGGNTLADFGTKFGFNYGGGVTLTGGPIGVNLDVRGYAVPKVTIQGFTGQQRLDFVQATAGITFRF
jgi:hypothetical protein